MKRLLIVSVACLISTFIFSEDYLKRCEYRAHCDFVRIIETGKPESKQSIDALFVFNNKHKTIQFFPVRKDKESGMLLKYSYYTVQERAYSADYEFHITTNHYSNPKIIRLHMEEDNGSITLIYDNMKMILNADNGLLLPL